MVSTILCPRCKTKNTKNAEICYHCQKPLKTQKKSKIVSFNTKSKLDLKIIAIGTLIFILSSVFVLYIVPDYSIMISGFATLLFLYLVFRNPEKSKDKSQARSLGLKVILNYLIIIVTGIIVIYLLNLYNIIRV